ncbi:Transmembrane cell adhesion receptor mua-3 [Exaiptasia diaphana]|nr:Transmembrane cell adhesion receptor mua-3 [Exaiptasia diaphana]
MDVIIILDGSGSVTQPNWFKSLQFSANLSSEILALNPRNKIGIVEYSQVAREAIPLTSNSQKIENGIKRLSTQYQNGITRTELALDEAIRMFKLESLNDENRVLIIVTDGRTTPLEGVPGKKLLADPITTLKIMKIHIIAVGVTQKVNDEELNMIASSGEDVLKLDGFVDLLKKVKQITKMANCPTPGKF